MIIAWRKEKATACSTPGGGCLLRRFGSLVLQLEVGEAFSRAKNCFHPMGLTAVLSWKVGIPTARFLPSMPFLVEP